MFFKDKLLILGPVILSLLIFINCSSSSNLRETDASSQDVYAESENVNKSLDVAKIGVERSQKFGQYLTDAGGRTLYMFLADNRGQSSSCYGRCAEVWPPLLTTGNPEAVANVVNAEMLGTIERRDGSLQVTYNGWPLYYYIKDQGQGELTGQDVKGFGAEWYLMAPSGSYIH